MGAPVGERADVGDVRGGTSGSDWRDDSEPVSLLSGGPVADPPPAPADDLGSTGTQVVAEQRRSGSTSSGLRVDFGAHLEANYQRLVAQLYAITLDPGEAHEAVQDAYSRAWRSWSTIGRSPDPSAWVRRVAVRSTARSWRRTLARVGIGRPRPAIDGVDQRTGALLAALARLSPAERRAVVMFHMAGSSMEEIAAVEQVSVGLVNSRLVRARQAVTEGMADVLPEVLGQAVGHGGYSEAYDGGYDSHGPSTYDPAYADRYGSGGYAAADSGEYAGYGYDAAENEGGRR